MQCFLTNRGSVVLLSVFISVTFVCLVLVGCRAPEFVREKKEKRKEVTQAEKSQAEKSQAERSVVPSLDVPKAGTPDETPLETEGILGASGEDKEESLSEKEKQLVEQVEASEGHAEKIKKARKQQKGTGTSEKYISENLIPDIENPEEKLPVEFNFDAASPGEVVPIFAQLLEFSYVIDPTVEGAITMTVDTEMTRKNVWKLFEHVLWLSGAYATRTESGQVDVLPFNKMPKERRIFVKHKPKANVVAKIVPLFHAKSKNIVQRIQPFLTEGANVTALPRLNSLLVVEAPDNMPKLQNLIRQLDSQGEAGWPYAIVQCEYAKAKQVKKELEALLPVLGYPVSRKTPSGGAIKLTAVPRLEVVVVSAALSDVVDKVKAWVNRLDQRSAVRNQNLYFYNVKHSTTDKLVQAVQTFFGSTSVSTHSIEETSKSASGKGGPPNKSGGAKAPPSPGDGSDSDALPEESVFNTPLTIYADDQQNRLTVRTTPQTYTMVKALLERLDASPRQVVMQAVIAEIKLNKGSEMGVSVRGSGSISGDELEAGSFGVEGVTGDNLTGILQGLQSGMAITLEDTKNGEVDEQALIRAIASRNDTRVLSAPQIVAVNKKEAKINVGDRVPIVTGEYTDAAADTSATSRDIEYEDTGIIMTVTPHITAANEVRLEVQQEVSNVADQTVEGINSPTISERTLKSQLVIDDGGTALMGGLIRRRETENRSGIPFLKDLPGVGGLFRMNSDSSTRTELLIMLTVNVIKSQDVTDKILQRYKEALAEIEDTLRNE